MNTEERSKLLSSLAVLADSYKPKAEHWINGTDESESWCRECGTFKIKHLRKHNYSRKSELNLDGGWLSDADSHPFCKGCHSLLEHGLTEHGVQLEIDHFVDINSCVGLDPLGAWLLLNMFSEADQYGDMLVNQLKPIEENLSSLFCPIN